MAQDGSCANDTEFDEWISGVTMEQIIISAFFDLNSYDTPIKFFMDDSWVSLRPGNSVVQTVFIKKNTLNLNDNYFGLFDT